MKRWGLHCKRILVLIHIFWYIFVRSSAWTNGSVTQFLLSKGFIRSDNKLRKSNKPLPTYGTAHKRTCIYHMASILTRHISLGTLSCYQHSGCTSCKMGSVYPGSDLTPWFYGHRHSHHTTKKETWDKGVTSHISCLSLLVLLSNASKKEEKWLPTTDFLPESKLALGSVCFF